VTDGLLTIGELARRTGRRTSAIRYYERLGLLPEPVRIGGQSRYGPGSVRTLAVIATAQWAGLSLTEVKAVLGAAGGDAAAAEELRGIAVRKLPEVTALIRRAEVTRDWLLLAAHCECPDLDTCPLFGDEADPAGAPCQGLPASAPPPAGQR
jgi:MerR family redox-sensitive transcriptional activator SoxR